MKNPSIQKTTAISLLVHSLFFMILFFTVKRRSHFIMPPAYTVNLVSIKKTPFLRKDSIMVRKILIPPEKTLVKQKSKPVPAKNVEKKVNKDIQKDRAVRIDERIAAIKAKKRIGEIARLRSIIDVKKKVDTNRDKAIHKNQQPTASEQIIVSEKMDETIMDAYYSSIENHIKKHWAFPDIGKENLLAIVSFKIKRDGNIELIQLEESSGNAFFDRSALKAISKAIPLPPPPFEMEVGIRFFP